VDFVDDRLEPAAFVIAKPHRQRIENKTQDAWITQHAARAVRCNSCLGQQPIQPNIQVAWPVRLPGAMIAVVETEQAPAIVLEQPQFFVQRRQFVQRQQHGEDPVLEAVMAGTHAAVHHPTFINC